jgi:hypothetical protein
MGIPVPRECPSRSSSHNWGLSVATKLRAEGQKLPRVNPEWTYGLSQYSSAVGPSIASERPGQPRCE